MGTMVKSFHLMGIQGDVRVCNVKIVTIVENETIKALGRSHVLNIWN